MKSLAVQRCQPHPVCTSPMLSVGEVGNSSIIGLLFLLFYISHLVDQRVKIKLKSPCKVTLPCKQGGPAFSSFSLPLLTSIYLRNMEGDIRGPQGSSLSLVGAPPRPGGGNQDPLRMQKKKRVRGEDLAGTRMHC